MRSARPNWWGRGGICGLVLWLWCASVCPLDAWAKSGVVRQVVFALDDSGSMRQNDPRGLSKQAGAMFVRLMDHDGALAVISFTGTSRVLLPLSELVDETIKQNAMTAITAMTHSGAHTHIESALESAHGLFSDDPDLQRALVLLTDGKIDLGGAPGASSDDEAESRRRILSTWIERYKARGIPVYTIAFGNDTDEALLREVARISGGMYFKVSQEREVAPIYFKIFNQIEKPQFAPVTDGGFQVDASIREATLIVEAPRDADSIVIQDPKGWRYRRNAATDKVRWGGNDAYLLATISKPRPGLWKVLGIEEKGGKVIVLTDVKLRAPEPRGVYGCDEPVYVLAQMDLGIGDATLPIDLRIRAELLDETGMTLDAVPLMRDGNGLCGDGQVDRLDDSYFAGFFPTHERRREGLYTLRITAEADTFSRQREHTIRVNSTPWLRLDETHFSPKRDQNLIIPLAYESALIDMPSFRLSEGNRLLPSMVDLEHPFSVRVQDPVGEWQNAQVAVSRDDRQLRVILLTPPKEGEYLIQVDAQTGADSLVCFAQQSRLTVPVRFEGAAKTSRAVTMGRIGWIGMGLGGALILILLILLLLNNRRLRRSQDDSDSPDMRDISRPLPKPKPAPTPSEPPLPRPEAETKPVSVREPACPVEPAPVAKREPEVKLEPQGSEITQSLDALIREMAKVEGEPHDAQPDDSSAAQEGLSATEGQETGDDTGTPPRLAPDPLKEIEKNRRVTEGIDLSEIESIISRMDQLAGGEGVSSNEGDPFYSSPKTSSIMEGINADSHDDETRRATLSRREYDAIDKAIDKMQRLATLRELSEGQPKPESKQKDEKILEVLAAEIGKDNDDDES